MPAVVITLQSPQLLGSKDLELPDDVPMSQLLPALVQVLGREFGLPPGHYQLARRSYVLRDHEMLSDVPIIRGDILRLYPARVAASQAGPGHGAVHYLSSSNLTTPNGRIIALNSFGKNELLIGRYDPRTQQVPDIDLSDEPQGDTVSRAHALLRRQDDQWFIVPTVTLNPTKVGNAVVQPQQSHLLKAGDVIALGDIRLTFT